MSDQMREVLDEWADKIAALEPEVRDGIAVRAIRMAADKRLRRADREFAQAQAEAVGRAVIRAKEAGRRKPRKR